MGTRARIAMKNEDGSYTSIYTHWDGYPSHHGPKLLHYDTQEKVAALVGLGDLSSLGSTIGVKHPFDGGDDDVCTAYGRDRGEKDVDAAKSASLEELKKLTQESGGEFLYVFDGGVWYCGVGGIAFFGNPADKEPGELHTLKEVMAKEAEEDAS
jgi:hypothetical protein